MSYIELGLEKGYIEKQPSDDEKVEVYIINPRKIILEVILTSIIEEFKELGYTVDFDDRKKVFIVNNLNLLKKEKEEAANNIEKVDSVCDECKEPYNDMLTAVKGAVVFISEDTKIDAKEVTGILCSKIYNDIIKWIDEGGIKKVEECEVTYEKLIDEIDALIRSMK